jgi:hypothetical protein
VDIVDIVTIDLSALLDSPALENLLVKLANKGEKPLPSLNVYAMNLLQSWEFSKETALSILVPRPLEKYSLGLKELLEINAPYKEIRIIIYDSQAIYRMHLSQSSYHITSSIINLFQNPHKNTGMITNYLTYLPLKIFCKRIRHFRVHFFGMFNILSHLPLILPLFCLFANFLVVSRINPSLVGRFFHVQRGLLIGSYLFMATGDNLASMLDTPYQRRKFYLKQIAPNNSQEFIQDYTSRELSLAILGIFMLSAFVLCFFLSPLGMFGGFLLGIFTFFSHTWAWYFKYPLRILVIVLLSFCIQFRTLLTIF